MNLHFAAPVHTGMELMAFGRVTRERRTSVETEGGIVYGDELLATAAGSYVFPTPTVLAKSLGVPVEKLSEKLLKYTFSPKRGLSSC